MNGRDREEVERARHQQDGRASTAPRRIPPSCETSVESNPSRHREHGVQSSGSKRNDRGDCLIVQP